MYFTKDNLIRKKSHCRRKPLVLYIVISFFSTVIHELLDEVVIKNGPWVAKPVLASNPIATYSVKLTHWSTCRRCWLSMRWHEVWYTIFRSIFFCHFTKLLHSVTSKCWVLGKELPFGCTRHVLLCIYLLMHFHLVVCLEHKCAETWNSANDFMLIWFDNGASH